MVLSVRTTVALRERWVASAALRCPALFTKTGIACVSTNPVSPHSQAAASTPNSYNKDS